MAGLSTIRPEIVTVVKTVTGMAEVLEHAPEVVGPTPLAYLGDAEAEVTMGQRERWSWTLPLTFATPRAGNYRQEQAAIEAKFELFMVAIRANITLGGDVTSVSAIRIREGLTKIGDQAMTALTVTLRVHESLTTTVTG